MASYTARAPFYSAPNSGGGKRSSWADPRDPPPHSNDRVFPHIKDIIASAQPLFNPSITLSQYLSEGETCLKTAKSSLSFGRPDTAFQNYLKASEIVINIIPRHKDYGFFEYNNKNWADRFKGCRLSLLSLSDQMENVKSVIENNNRTYGTQQKSTTSGQNAISTPSHNSPLNSQTSRASVGSIESSKLSNDLGSDRSTPTSAAQSNFHNFTIPTNDLNSRFAQLRMSNSKNGPGQVLAMPKASDFQTNSTQTASNGRPIGPRDMPNAPSLPPKVPLDAVLMLKAPDPTYSPANISTGVQVARSSHDGNRPPTERKQMYYGQPVSSVPSTQSQRIRDDIQPYRPKTPNGINHIIVPKSSSIDIPHNHTVSAEALSGYIRKYNVLLVDVRERVMFDEGHIFATSILCVEPLSLKEGMSAEGLEERLVLSPDNEQNLFSRRNEFDLVVYYDQDTSDISYLKGPPTMNKTPHLRAFFDTMYEFNEYKPLKDGRPPALLYGGLDAWMDHMGPQSLATSKTAAMLGTTRQRSSLLPARSLTRQRMASANSRFEVRERRLRHHKFLDEKEQQAWRQQAQQEHVTAYDHEDLIAGEQITVEEDFESTSPYVPDYEAFLRRFPAMEQQSMTMPIRRPPPPIPQRYEPASVPSIPTRPPPAIPRPSYSGQADIIQPQASLARVTSSTRQPLYSSTLSLRNRKVPSTGLTNFGVTCYMNSTLQCLSATIPLSQLFLDDNYKHNVQKNWKGSSGIMPEIYANVIRSLWKGDVQVIKPTTFRNFCGRMNREWVIDRQQDAKEFFDFLVDCLHEDLNMAWERTPLKPLTTEQEMQREKYAITEAGPIEWQRYQHRDYSFISTLFAGQHASRLKCLSCRNTSTTYEAFYSISIEIPRSGQGDISRCLESYTREERLSELWRCPYCKCEREATKQIILTRLPQFLVIHFKRFSASKTESARKIHTPIDFPLQGLKMDPFIYHKGPKPPVSGSEDTQNQLDAATSPPFTYDAYGVLRHLGSSGDGGHYVSIVKDPGRGCWRKFDDERHYDFDPSQLGPRDRLQNGEAYIVFYQKTLAR